MTVFRRLSRNFCCHLAEVVRAEINADRLHDQRPGVRGGQVQRNDRLDTSDVRPAVVLNPHQ